MKVTALVTLFYPDLATVKNINVLSLQVDRVILLDNTPSINNGFLFSELDVDYIANLENLGLSAAFNKGFNHIKEKPTEFVIYFDQDSTISDGLINNLIESYNELSENHKIGCIGPAYYDENSKTSVEHKDKTLIKNGLFSVKSVITSSLLTKYEVIEDIDGWNASIFLDYADWDFCWRVKEKGYLLILDSKQTLNHSLGDSSVNFGKVSFPKYSPVREYYRIRDSLKLFTKSYVPNKYKIKFLFTWFVEPFIYIYLFPSRFSRIKYVLRAFKDYFLKVNGPSNYK